MLIKLNLILIKISGQNKKSQVRKGLPVEKASAGEQVQGKKEGNGGRVSVYAHMKLSKNKRFLSRASRIRFSSSVAQ